MSRGAHEYGMVETLDDMVVALSPLDVSAGGWVLCKLSALWPSVEVLVTSMLRLLVVLSSGVDTTTSKMTPG